VTARRFAPARPLAVTSDPTTGVPAWVRWRGRDERVARIEATWTVDRGWWEAEGSVARRRYVRLLTHGGLLCVVYQERGHGGWYLEKIVD